MKANDKVIVGVTGGICSGKSTFLKYLTEFRYSTVSADEVYHKLITPGNSGYKVLVENFGKEILSPEGTVDRKNLSRIVFTDRTMLNRLDNAVHPLICQKILEEVEGAKNHIVYVEVPLLFEKRDAMEKEGLVFDEVIVVYCDRKTQVERMMVRDGVSEEEAERRLGTQMDIETKKKKANFVLSSMKGRRKMFQEAQSFLVFLSKKYFVF